VVLVPALVVPTRAPELVVATLRRTGRDALGEAADAAAAGAGAVLTTDPGTVQLLAAELGLPVVVAVHHPEELALASSLGAAACLVPSADLARRPVPGLAVLAPPEAVLVGGTEPGLAAAEAAAALAAGARVLAGPAVRVLRRCADVWAVLEAERRP
jgi:hypothetical protein